MAIIVDNIAWESVEREVMATDGTDIGITIPAFLIDYFEGEQLKQYVHANNTTDELSDTDTEIFNIQENENGTHPVILQANINLAGKTDNNLTVDIWYSSIYEIALDS